MEYVYHFAAKVLESGARHLDDSSLPLARASFHEGGRFLEGASLSERSHPVGRMVP